MQRWSVAENDSIRSEPLSQVRANNPPRAVGAIVAICSVFVLGSMAYWLSVGLVAGREGFPLDDAFIHLQFARNLLESGEMAFNAGTPSSGCTAPGFAGLIAVAQMFVGDWIRASFLVTLLASLGTALLVHQILLRWTKDAEVARWGGIVVAIACPTIIQAFSGMESAVYSFICLLAVAAYGAGGRRMRYAGALLLASCIWFRPEFLVGCPLVFVEWVWRRYRRLDGDQKATIVEILWMLGIWSGMAAMYVGFHYRIDGHFVPATFAAKAVAHFALRPHWLEGLPAIVRHGNWAFLPLALIVLPIVNLLVMGVGLFTVCAPLAFGLEASAKRMWRVEASSGAGWRLAILLLFGYPLARAFVDPAGTLWYQGQRYFAHLTPLFVLIVFGAWPMTRSLVAGSRWNWTRRPFRSQARIAAMWAGAASMIAGIVAVISVKNINDMQVNTAHWIREHSTDADLIAVNDIGAIGFLSGRRVLDTVGLVEPAITEHYLNGGKLSMYLAEQRPRYVVVFPTWYPEFASIEGGLVKRAAFTTTPNVVCGGAELVVYEPDWHRFAGATVRRSENVPGADAAVGHAQSLP